MRVTIALAAVAWLVAVAGCAVTGWPLAIYRDGDFFAFWAGSRSLFEGRDPYDLAWWTAIHAREGSAELTFLWPLSGPQWPSVYPLWTDLVFLPVAIVPIGFGAAVWLVSQVMAVLAVVVVLWRLILGHARTSLLLVIAIVTGSYPFWLLIVGGNMTGWLFAIYWGAVGLALTERYASAGAIIGLVLLKPQALLVAVPAALATLPRQRPRAALAGLAVATALFVTTIVLRPAWIGEWLSSLAIARTVPLSNSTVWTLDRAIGQVPWIGPAMAIGLGLATFWWVARSRPSWLWVVCASTALSVAVAPYGWSYDELLLLPVALPIIAVTSGWRTAERVAMLLATAVVLDVLPWILHAVALRRGGEELNAFVPVLALGLVVLAHAHPRSGPRSAMRRAHR